MREITYECIFISPIGRIRLITTDHALVRLSFDEEADSSASLVACPDVMKIAVLELELYFEGKLNNFSVSIFQDTTPFRQRVYDELSKIPYGETISYKELALKIGDAKAARAVGSANKNNKIPIIIPCHRVIGADGSLSGYAGGVSRKKFLLELEAKSRVV